MTYRVGYLVGSLAKGSINRKLAKALVRLAPAGAGDDRDRLRRPAALQLRLRRRLPAGGARLQGGARGVEAFIFVTPEYNRSIPGGLKNAIDWASRPYGENSFDRKPSAVIGTSPGMIGTALAQQSLRGVLAFCNSPMMNAIEAYIQFKPGLITDDGEVTDESTRDFLKGWIDEFAAFFEPGLHRAAAADLSSVAEPAGLVERASPGCRPGSGSARPASPRDQLARAPGVVVERAAGRPGRPGTRASAGRRRGAPAPLRRAEMAHGRRSPRRPVEPPLARASPGRRLREARPACGRCPS